MGSKQKDGSRKIDKSRWSIWTRIVSGNLKIGTISLNERDGKLKLSIPYYVEPRGTLDDSRTLEVAFNSEQDEFIKCIIREGQKGFSVDLARREKLSCLEALASLDRLSAQRDKHDKRRRSCGNKGKAYRSATEKLGRITKQRTNTTEYWNHLWSKIVTKIAERWDCGKIQVFDIPKDLFGRSWPWASFVSKLQYKADLYNATTSIHQSPKLDEIENAKERKK